MSEPNALPLLLCRDETRRQILRDRSLNGVDDVDVHGTHLCVHFLTGIPPEFLPAGKEKQLSKDEQARALRRIVIHGGRRVTGIKAIRFHVDRAANRFEESCLGIDVDREGDWSSYTLCFVELDEDGRPTDRPLRSLDPRYACLSFTFRSECPAEVDCKTDDACPPVSGPAPAISYLAKDYATFRQLLLDRLALVMPEWRERHVPDLGITLVELLAYTADYLSYYQDSVGTEQYLDTARQRISVRRHARLIDYRMHDGCNARTFVHVRAGQEVVNAERRDLFFITRPSGAEVKPVLLPGELDQLPAGWLPFEPLSESETLTFYSAHNTIRIYTWGNDQCCLPKGATRATLLDEDEEHDDPKVTGDVCAEEEPPPPNPYGHDHEHHEGCGCPPPPPPPGPPRPLHLAIGDFLLFEELACAGTVSKDFDGETPQPDTDRTHRHVVRLTKVTPGCDPLLGNRVLEVEWSAEDALPFQLCISAVGIPPQCDLVRNLAVARGNLVLADHGLTIVDEPLDPVPAGAVTDACDAAGAPADVPNVAGRYRPILQEGPLTFSEPVKAGASASALLQQNPREALPAIEALGIPVSGLTDERHRPLPLFRADVLRSLRFLASSLKDATRGDLVALRRRLRKTVLALIDQNKIDEALEPLDANLRELTDRWLPRLDLLGSSGEDAHFVAEVDDRGLAHLRFGDGDAGRAVDAGMEFAATYRAGNGRAGLVGADSIVHLVFRRNPQPIEGVRNPLPARGAVDPEPIAAVKAFAPASVHGQLQRAVTAGDYATLAQSLRDPERDPRMQGALGQLIWNGSWYEADVSIDPSGAIALDSALQEEITGKLEPRRRMGHDLRVQGADVVPIRLELELCVDPHYLRAHVVSAVRDALGSNVLPGGRRGFFHPDNLTFGEAVYVSRIVAAVMAVEGVVKVCVVRLERLDAAGGANPDLPNGLLKMRPNEIARLDADASLPENGILGISDVRGGR